MGMSGGCEGLTTTNTDANLEKRNLNIKQSESSLEEAAEHKLYKTLIQHDLNTVKR